MELESDDYLFDEAPDQLQMERERSSLVWQELMDVVMGWEFVTMKRDKEMVILNDPVFERSDEYYLSREDQFDRVVKKYARFNIIKRMGKFTNEEIVTMRTAICDELPDAVHDHLFVPTILSQGTDEQKKKWLPLAKSYSILGAFAQTELGHGTNVQGLETTATYNPSSQEFTLNSPTLTSMKWWPGALGHIATHAIVVARLITFGKDHGPHPFMVQLRSLDDHKPLPGIKLCDIGPALGYKGVNNGSLKLTNVAIPRDHLLMKYAQVLPDGTYNRPVLDKISYATMVHGRVGSLLIGCLKLAHAVTIAVRYSIVRKECLGESGIEVVLLDHQSQQYKLLTLVACVYALLSTEDFMDKLYLKAVDQIAKRNFELLPEVHATSCGLKALFSDLNCQGIEACRLACGGHGYSLTSGLATVYADTTTIQHFEGDNVALMLQSARYLHKMFSRQLSQSQLPSNIVYLASDYPVRSCTVKTPDQFLNAQLLLEIYQQRARRMVEAAAEEYTENINEGMDSELARNECSIDWINAARAHSYLVVLKAFAESIENTKLSPANRSILIALCSLFAVHGIIQYTGEFVMDEYMSARQIAMARTHLYALLKEIRQEAVPLVDAFNLPDRILNSDLGRYDGDVYTSIYNSAVNSPSNKSEVHKTAKKLQPHISTSTSKL